MQMIFSMLPLRGHLETERIEYIFYTKEGHIRKDVLFIVFEG